MVVEDVSLYSYVNCGSTALIPLTYHTELSRRAADEVSSDRGALAALSCSVASRLSSPSSPSSPKSFSLGS